jgi:hypothetical protein
MSDDAETVVRKGDHDHISVDFALGVNLEIKVNVEQGTGHSQSILRNEVVHDGQAHLW